MSVESQKGAISLFKDVLLRTRRALSLFKVVLLRTTKAPSLFKDVRLRARRALSLIKDIMLRTRRALLIFKDVLLRTRRALSLYKVNGDSSLLILNWTTPNSDSARLALNWWWVIEYLLQSTGQKCHKGLFTIFTIVWIFGKGYGYWVSGILGLGKHLNKLVQDKILRKRNAHTEITCIWLLRNAEVSKYTLSPSTHTRIILEYIRKLLILFHFLKRKKNLLHFVTSWLQLSSWTHSL